MKKIINVFGKAEIGKTTVIKTAYAKMKNINFSDIPNGDICEIIQTGNGRLIGFASAGDPDSNQGNDIQSLIDKKCDIIVCASRTKGNTSKKVEGYAADNDYLLMKMSPLTTIGWLGVWGDKKETIDILTEINAETIVNLIHKLITIEK